MSTTTVAHDQLLENVRLLQDVKSYAYWTRDKKFAYCPVARRKAGQLPESGIVVVRDGLYEPTVYLANLFSFFEPKFERRDEGPIAYFKILPNYDVPVIALPARRLDYVSTMAMIEAGWEVD